MNKKCFVFVFIILFLVSNSLASTTTYERTLDDLQVSEDINVNSYNRNIILNTPKVNELEKIYDFADLFTDNEEALLYNKVNNYISKSNLDMAIVTIDYNPKNSAMNYADDFYDYNYFGTGSTHDGVLFLIDMDTREMYISTTGEAILVYDDNRIDKILDDTYIKISNKDYYGCADKFVEKAEHYFILGIPSSNLDSTIDSNGDYIYDEYGSSYDVEAFLVFLVISFVIALIIVFIMKGKHRTIKKATSAWAYMHNPAFTYIDDSFLTTNTVSVYDPPASSSGSSRSGGSSSHRSSSGRSHGGGGRRF